VAATVSLVALLVGLSLAPRLLPSDTFQVKPRAVKSQPHEPGASMAPGSVPQTDAAAPLTPDALCAVAGWSPERLDPAGDTRVPFGSGPGRVATAAGCRGPPA
jgi:hypothetical protein